MKRRVWTTEGKLPIMLEGMRAQGAVAELCNRHQISQAKYYAWRDQLVSEEAKPFAHGSIDRQAEQAARTETATRCRGSRRSKLPRSACQRATAKRSGSG